MSRDAYVKRDLNLMVEMYIPMLCVDTMSSGSVKAISRSTYQTPALSIPSQPCLF
jgi:hypothetical protein